jgi:hypothetical protein
MVSGSGVSLGFAWNPVLRTGARSPRHMPTAITATNARAATSEV